MMENEYMLTVCTILSIIVVILIPVVVVIGERARDTRRGGLVQEDL